MPGLWHFDPLFVASTWDDLDRFIEATAEFIRDDIRAWSVEAHAAIGLPSEVTPERG